VKILPGKDIGIDLGTSTVLINIKGKGIVLKEPSVVAVDKNTEKIVAIGTDALKMMGRTPGNIVAVRPLREGVISNYELTQQMLKFFIKKIGANFLFKPRIMISVPSMITEVEERAVFDAASQAGARKVFLIEEPIAAAIGAGIDISRPCGNMVIDIGGGTTDIAVLSLKDISVSTSIKIAGDRFDETIIKYIRKQFNVLIGERTAEEIKIKIGCVYPRDEISTMTVKGRCLITGLPKMIEVNSEQIQRALTETAMAICEAVHSVLENTPPELVGDISTNGIVMTGGGSLLFGLDKLISNLSGVPVRVADDAVSCVAKGTGKALENLNQLQDGLLFISKNKNFI
jgi:rod shape-determining protein MreB